MEDQQRPQGKLEKLRVLILWNILPAVVLLSIIKFVGKGIALPIIILSLAAMGFSLLMLFTYRHELVSRYRKLSQSSRLYIWGTAFWTVFVFGYVLTFDPFGYMYKSDWIKVWKIILFPPLIVGLGQYSYLKMVKHHKDD